MRTPNVHLTNMTKRYPDAWHLSDTLRQDRGRDGLPDWPAWCYLPMSGWYAIISQATGQQRLAPEQAADISCLAALGAWRYTQGIYCIQPDLLSALSSTVPTGDLPVEVILRMPEWCVYIETDGLDYDGMPLAGFFAYLEHDANTERAELRLVLAYQDGRLAGGTPLHLGPWTVTEAVDRAMSEARVHAHRIPGAADRLTDAVVERAAQSSYSLVSLLLYLCSDEPDIAGHVPGTYPRHPAPKKTKKGLRLFPPDKPHIWRVGEVVGEALRKAQVGSVAVGADMSGRRGTRPHIRRAHWHGYWTGPRSGSDSDKRRFGYRWLPPIIVGIDD
ncbi:hypothetical protein LJC59_07525 [Desulfovibrio sp. OttesenSCG-928-A18]|nr:hypothetical protein [Desulfovibrio sp. OttesenSCG-928-A18]